MKWWHAFLPISDLVKYFDKQSYWVVPQKSCFLQQFTMSVYTPLFSIGQMNYQLCMMGNWSTLYTWVILSVFCYQPEWLRENYRRSLCFRIVAHRCPHLLQPCLSNLKKYDVCLQGRTPEIRTESGKKFAFLGGWVTSSLGLFLKMSIKKARKSGLFLCEDQQKRSVRICTQMKSGFC